MGSESIIMHASDYRLGLQWMPVDLLIQHMHCALKVIYSYRYYNYTDEHSILLKPPIAFGHHHTYTTWGLSLYANFMLTFFNVSYQEIFLFISHILNPLLSLIKLLYLLSIRLYNHFLSVT